MYQIILMIHVLVAMCIVALVLLQQGKGATMGAAFGSGASQTIFGSRGSGSFLFRVTIVLIGVFFGTSIILNYLVMRSYKQETSISMPIQLPSTQVPNQQKTPPVETKPAQKKNELQTEIPIRK